MWQNTDKLVDHFSQLIMVSLIMINTSTAATSDFHLESVKSRDARQKRTRKLCTRLKPKFAGRKTRGVLQSVPFRKWWEKESKKEKMFSSEGGMKWRYENSPSQRKYLKEQERLTVVSTVQGHPISPWNEQKKSYFPPLLKLIWCETKWQTTFSPLRQCARTALPSRADPVLAQQRSARFTRARIPNNFTATRTAKVAIRARLARTLRHRERTCMHPFMTKCSRRIASRELSGLKKYHPADNTISSVW